MHGSTCHCPKCQTARADIFESEPFELYQSPWRRRRHARERRAEVGEGQAAELKFPLSEAEEMELAAELLNFEAEPFEFDEGFELAHDEFQPEQFLGWFDKPKPAVAQTGVAAAARPLFQKAAVAAKAGMPPEKVCWIQNVLNGTQGERLATDGIYGPLTQEAVRRFQARNSLLVDGIVGPQTETALIQSALSLPVNGVMDTRTREAIVLFQVFSFRKDIPEPMGIVGPKTRAVMVGGRCR